MTLGPDVEALVQGALDESLTPEERETLDRLMTESVDVRGRLAHLQELTRLLESLGPAEPPASLVPDVLARISANARSSSSRAQESTSRVADFRTRTSASRPIAFGRRFGASRKIMVGLAAAAVLVLAFATFRGYPPAPEGTEATIGAPPGGASARSMLQPATWNAIVNDERLRMLLQDANARAVLAEAALQQALKDPVILEALRDPAFSDQVRDAGKGLRNEAFERALRNDAFRRQLTNPEVAAALAGPAFQQALEDPGFSAALGQARVW
jgi:hypothetical protein